MWFVNKTSDIREHSSPPAQFASHVGNWCLGAADGSTVRQADSADSLLTARLFVLRICSYFITLLPQGARYAQNAPK